MELKAKTENMLHIAEWTTSDTESAVERHHSFGDSVKYWLIEGFIPFGGVVFYEVIVYYIKLYFAEHFFRCNALLLCLTLIVVGAKKLVGPFRYCINYFRS